MHLKRDSAISESRGKGKRILHADPRIVGGVPKKCGRRLIRDLMLEALLRALFRGGIRAKQTLSASYMSEIRLHRNHGVAEDRTVWNMRHSVNSIISRTVRLFAHKRACRKVSAGGKSANDNPLGIDLPLLCVIAQNTGVTPLLSSVLSN